jgi:hypothetical protein
MKIDINKIAEKMKEKGWNSSDDSERFLQALSNILLEETKIVENVLNEMERVESENEDNAKMTRLDYLEKIGEV